MYVIKNEYKNYSMKYRFLIKLIFTCLIFTTTFVSVAQQSLVATNFAKEYTIALEHYNNKAYAIAEKNFESIKNKSKIGTNLKADASFFEAMCAVKLNKPEADKKVLTFVEENPNSNKKNRAFFTIANYYFANKKAAYALKWFQKVNIDELSTENKKELNFKMGYALLVTKNLAQAKTKFLPLINDAKYGNDSRYYYGFISYKLEDYGIAESTLKEIADNDSYRAEISYYLLDISFKAGKFKRCINVGLKIYETIEKKLKSDVAKIIGESYFNLEKYAEAIPYLKSYKGIKGKWNNTDYYQLGYAYYKQKDFENAINNFNKIIDQKNAVSQNAYYHLGECYMNLEKKSEALNAFKSASEMSFNTNIQEDAALNYAKLSYEEGNPFKPVANILQDYLKKYPKSSAYEEINQLLVTSFLSQNNFEGALEFLKRKKSKENKKLIQEISLYRGLQLFNNNEYNNALPYFLESSNATSKTISNKAKYWEAESLYRLNKYGAAVNKFINLKKSVALNTNEFLLIDYNIGYSYFKLAKYNLASTAFKDFVKKDAIKDDVKYDALIRLGDCYFALTKYSNAIETYQLVTKNFGLDADYAQYQIGMSFGFIDKNEAKIDALKKVINNYTTSNLKDDALYQLATTYTNLKDTKNAIIAFERLVEKHPQSIFIPRALLRQGLLYFNDDENKKSLASYKEVAAKFPNSPEALEAVANARNVYIDEGNLEDYVNWIRTLEFINITNVELDNTTFAVAEKKYLSSKNAKEIIENLQTYLRKFRNGIHIIKANYYLADVYYKLKDFKKAKIYYQFLTDKEISDFTEDSLNKLAQIYLQENDFNSALPLLDRLEQQAYIAENILFAQSNLMQGYYESKAYDFAIEYAKKLLQKDKLQLQVANDAKIIIARSAIATEDFYTAEDFYTQIETTANGVLKAEALYYNAYFKNQQKAYEASNKVIQNLIANFSSYKYWSVKSYVIMGKNYAGLNDVYQANFVLENIIKNFKEFEDITKEAQLELEKIKEKQAKTNNSINSEKKN